MKYHGQHRLISGVWLQHFNVLKRVLLVALGVITPSHLASFYFEIIWQSISDFYYTLLLMMIK